MDPECNNPQQALDSRKFKMGLLCMLIIVSMAASTMWLPQMAAVMVEVIGGLVAIYGIYCGANIANKWAVGRTMVDLGSQSDRLNRGLPDDPRGLSRRHSPKSSRQLDPDNDILPSI